MRTHDVVAVTQSPHTVRRTRRDRIASAIGGRFLIAVSLVCAACHSAATAPTTTTPDTWSTQSFGGSLDPGGTATQSFTAPAAGSLAVTLASAAIDPNQPLAPVLAVGFGTPGDSECVVSTTVRMAPALTAQLTGSIPAGTFCVAVSD